jgi:hypothetical protein
MAQNSITGEQEKSIDPHSIFLQAENFHQASKLISHTMRTSPPDDWHPELIIPDVVISAFACELYFKCMLTIEKKSDPPRIHHLDRLFTMLSADLQQKIERRWDAYVENSKMIGVLLADTELNLTREAFWLVTVLWQARKAFEEWRYVFEEEPQNGFGAVTNLLFILREILIEMNPPWGEFKRVKK